MTDSRTRLAAGETRRSRENRTDSAHSSEFGGISEFRVEPLGRATDAAA